MTWLLRSLVGTPSSASNTCSCSEPASPTSPTSPASGASASASANAQSTETTKQVQDAAAYIRGLAQLRGRNVQWAERAVREAVSLSANEALAKAAVDLSAWLKKEAARGDESHVLGPVRYAKLLRVQEGLTLPLADFERMNEEDLATNKKAYEELLPSARPRPVVEAQLFTTAGRHEDALFCWERTAQLAPENIQRQLRLAEAAEKLNKTALAARAYLRTGQLASASGATAEALQFLGRAYKLAPHERGVALLYADATLKSGDAATAAALLEPFAANEKDATFLDTYADALRKIVNDTRTSGLEIIRAKGATYYGIGTALARIAVAILRDEHAVLTVSSLVPQSMELGEVSLSLPAIITRNGLARVLSIPLDASETQALVTSAETLKRHIAALKTSEPSLAI